ncbi:Predicted arabinose efflux permease, MFS family [Saccharopolyspora antimicrobica]|uniref:MFS family arabinose efflux permease n=1 Tax=Saccharopolyspora antimicrobica TaxID=455193 RepID=A0A1I4RBB4_9PSEU|nr:MFS transporter [Saccharopolyspora antimicrobica]RKT88079.1 putative MFS family arabinose efflux permease [Saccharopolyspora antimicrobica]SFM49588.1 Predicted arabinose efflux permease, MFS family [Saccharopolyspora antimicrobica]
MPRWIVALSLGALVFYTDDYVIAGVLPEIATDLAVSEGTAGQLVTVFSVTVALAAPVAAIAAAHVRRRTLLTAAAAVFTLANALAATATGFEALLVLRVVAALAAAAATPALFSLAAQLAPPERIGRYVAAVAFGVTGAIALGVPAGTWIGGALSWRATFMTMAIAGALITTGFATQLPGRTNSSPALSLRSQLTILLRPAISLGLAANVTLMLGSMMLLTYLAPFTAALSTADISARGALFAFSGVAGMVGIWAGGIATDKWGPVRTLAAGIGVFILTVVVLAALWTVRPVPVLALLPVVALQGAAAFWTSPAIQARLHQLAGPVSAQALAMNTSGTYLGAALGGVVGGLAIDTSGPGPLPVIAGAAGLVALVLLLLTARGHAPEPGRTRADHRSHR